MHSVKKVNAFASKDPTSMVEAVKAVEGSHVHWQELVKEGSTVKHDEAFKLK